MDGFFKVGARTPAQLPSGATPAPFADYQISTKYIVWMRSETASTTRVKLVTGDEFLIDVSFRAVNMLLADQKN